MTQAELPGQDLSEHAAGQGEDPQGGEFPAQPGIAPGSGRKQEDAPKAGIVPSGATKRHLGRGPRWPGDKHKVPAPPWLSQPSESPKMSHKIPALGFQEQREPQGRLWGLWGSFGSSQERLG